MRTKLLLLILFILSVASVSYANEEVVDNVFEVKSLKAFADSDSLDNAQREAINEVTKEAFETLLKRMLPQSMHWKLDNIKKEQAYDLVKATKVNDERKTSHSYMATVDIEFSSDAVRNLLNVLGINYADEYAKPMLIVPYIIDGKNKSIWKDEKWVEAWGMAPSVVGLQKFSFMLGDIEDMSFFEDKDLSKYEFKDYTKLLKKYEASEVLLIEATKNKDTFAVQLRMLSEGDDVTQATTYKFDARKPMEEIYQGLVDDVLNKVDEYFKGVDLFDKKKVFRTRLYIQTDWANMSKELAKISEITETSVIKSSTNLTVVDMMYSVEPIEMSTILAKKGFEIIEDGDYQYLRRVKN